MSGYGCFVDPQRGVWLKTYYYSCKLVAFLLAANEKKGILDFIYLIQPRTNRNIAHYFVLYLVILLAAHLRFQYVMVLSLSFFHEAKLQVICFSVWGQVVANLKGKTSWDRFNC